MLAHCFQISSSLVIGYIGWEWIQDPFRIGSIQYKMADLIFYLHYNIYISISNM